MEYKLLIKMEKLTVQKWITTIQHKFSYGFILLSELLSRNPTSGKVHNQSTADSLQFSFTAFCFLRY